LDSNALKKGEDSTRQFKVNINSIDKLAVEISAFANSNGGEIYLGVDDDGKAIGLSSQDIKRLNQWISNATSQKIEPPIFVETKIILVNEKTLMIIKVPLGFNKPYSVNKSEFWVKNGADKRRASREELFRLMQSSGGLYADEMDARIGIEAFDFFYFSEFYQLVYGNSLDNLHIEKPQLLKNLKLATQDNHLTLAGLLLFGKHVEFVKPQFGIKATYYYNEDEFLDKEDIGGKLFEQQKKGVDFILRHLKRPPLKKDFNAPGELEIPAQAIQEAITNALIHRDYFINSAIFINIFDDRVEIVSSGVLPNTLNIENIKLGIHIERNPIILSFMAKFPDTGYTGRGSGIPRMLRLCQDKNVPLSFINDIERQQFKVIFYRQ
jgi:predicted HTH transcriptional regulator